MPFVRGNGGATFSYLLMCLVSRFTAATGIITLERRVISSNAILHTFGVREGLQKAKEYANKVKQCCEVYK